MGTMFDSTLSPRLAHLLIQEDSTTGRLIMPDGTDARDPLALSPPLTPGSTFAFEPSPITKSITLPPLESSLVSTLRLPPPTGRSDRKPSLISLLSNSPPDSSSSNRTLSAIPSGSALVPPSPPLTAFPRQPPLSWPSHRPAPLATRPLPTAPASGSFPNRPDVFRRHSVMSYEADSSHPYPQVSPSKGYLLMEESMGSRAPISRATKACNACRTRKVRCDAGGLPGGQPGTCSRCRESGVDCVYSVVQKKRGPCPGTIRGSAVKPRRRSSCRDPELLDAPRPSSMYDEPYPRYPGHSSSFPPRGSQEWTSMPLRPLSGNSRRTSKSKPYGPPSPSTSGSDSRRASGDSTRSDLMLERRAKEGIDEVALT